jgi:uncharacterized BrkB/YihY/UPF0761 family membrane protein
MISLTIIVIFALFVCIYTHLDRINVPVKVNFILSGVIASVIILVVNAILR